MQIRRLDPTHAAAALVVVTSAIRRTEGSTYTPAQVEAWLQGMDESRFRGLLAKSTALGAFEGDELLGFATFLEATEVLDFLYVSPAAWRRGVGRGLVREIERHARSVGSREVRVDASLLARPLLEQLGYSVVSQYRKEVHGVAFDNTWLSKTL